MIDELAGVIGCDPEPLTLRRLVWRVAAKQKETWTHTAALLSMLEACRQSNTPFDPFKWNPYEKQRKAAPKRSTPEEQKTFWNAVRAGEGARVSTRARG